MSWLRLLAFTFFVPGFVAGWVPYRLYSESNDWPVDTSYIAWPVLLIGALFYTWSALSFMIQGKGTPAIWFTQKLSKILGSEPDNLVASGMYRFSRNPMYVGVLLVILGWSLYLQSTSILVYFGTMVVFFHLVVTLLEEPHLSKKFGVQYDQYKKRTNRWLGWKSFRA